MGEENGRPENSLAKETQAEGMQALASAWARPLVPVTLAFMAGVAAPVWGLKLSASFLQGSLVVLGLALTLSWWLRLKGRILPLICMALLGAALCQQAREPVFPPHHLAHLPADQEVTLLARLDKPGKLGAERVQLFATAEARRAPEGWLPATGRTLLSAPRLEPPPVGTGMVLKGRLREVEGLKNPGAFQQARHWAAEGIFRQVSVRQEADLIVLKGAEAYPLGERLRGGIRRLLKERDDVTRSLYLAMLLGDQGEITPAQRQAFSRTGTSHLLVINGLHLSMVAAAVYFLFSWVLRRFAWLLLRVNIFKICTVLAAAAVVAYAWVAGGSPSTQRAEVMVLSYLLLVFLGRAREVWSALALAALVILVLSPLRLFAISFQLSFAAVTALIILVPRWAGSGPNLEGPLDRHPAWSPRIWFRVKEWVFASAAASLATAPLVAYYFQVVSVLGWLVNVVAIPLVLVLALPLGEAAVFCQAIHLGPVAGFLLTVGSLPLRLGYWAIEQTARLPGAALSLPTPTLLQVVLCYLLICAILVVKRPAWRWGGALAAAMIMAGTLLLPRLTTPPHLEVTCLDSRTGLDGVAVTPAGQRLVFSAAWEGWTGSSGGGGFGALPSYLHWRQFRELDLVVALGLNRRNAGELLTVAQQFKLRGFWFRDLGDKSQPVLDLRNTLGDQGNPARSLEKARPPTDLGALALAYPTLGEGQALGLLLAYEGRRVLIVPPRQLAEGATINLPGGQPPDVLVAPGDWPDALLARLKPRVLVTYGSRRRGKAVATWEGIERFATSEGAVSLYLTAAGVKVGQWQAP